jgi:chromosome segregation ATPase
MKTVTQERDEYKASVETLTQQLAEANKLRTEADGKLVTAQTSVTDLTGKLATADGKVVTLTGNLTIANDKISKLEGDKQTAEQKAAQIVAEAGGKPSQVAGASIATDSFTAETARIEYKRLQAVKPSGQKMADAFYMKHRDLFVAKNERSRFDQ